MGICGDERSWIVIGVDHRDGEVEITYVSTAGRMRVKQYDPGEVWLVRGEVLFS